jgi:hypothetical protein
MSTNGPSTAARPPVLPARRQWLAGTAAACVIGWHVVPLRYTKGAPALVLAVVRRRELFVTGILGVLLTALVGVRSATVDRR